MALQRAAALEQQTMHLHKCDHVNFFWREKKRGGGGGGVVRLTAKPRYLLLHHRGKEKSNTVTALLPVSWDTFIWSIFEGSIDVSFAAFDIPQSCAFHSMTFEIKNKDGVWKLHLVISLFVNVYFWLTFCTFDVIYSEKLVLK